MPCECDVSIRSALFRCHASHGAKAARLHALPPTFPTMPSCCEMLVKRIRDLQWSHCPLRSLLLHLLSLQGTDKPQRSMCIASTLASPSSEFSYTLGNTYVAIGLLVVENDEMTIYVVNTLRTKQHTPRDVDEVLAICPRHHVGQLGLAWQFAQLQANNCNHSGPYGKLCTSALRLLVVASTCYTSRVLAPIRSFLHDIRACGGGICTLCNSSVNQGRSSKSLSLRKVVASVFACLLALSCPMPYAPWRTLGKEARICSPCVARCA